MGHARDFGRSRRGERNPDQVDNFTTSGAANRVRLSRSGPIRKFIGPSRASALEQAKALQEGSDTGDNKEATIEDLCARLTRCMVTLTKCNDD